jgi:dual specificity tyrosine-phosphorylation-regulated kinase 2/3/4
MISSRLSSIAQTAGNVALNDH